MEILEKLDPAKLRNLVLDGLQTVALNYQEGTPEYNSAYDEEYGAEFMEALQFADIRAYGEFSITLRLSENLGFALTVLAKPVDLSGPVPEVP
jgi:hypothetical protein